MPLIFSRNLVKTYWKNFLQVQIIYNFVWSKADIFKKYNQQLFCKNFHQSLQWVGQGFLVDYPVSCWIHFLRTLFESSSYVLKWLKAAEDQQKKVPTLLYFLVDCSGKSKKILSVFVWRWRLFWIWNRWWLYWPVGRERRRWRARSSKTRQKYPTCSV